MEVTGGHLYHRRMAEAAASRGARVDFVSTSCVRNPLRDAEGVVRLLLGERELVRVGEALVARAALDGLKDDVRRRWAPGARLDVGAIKELTGLSRKYVIPLLEYLDRERVTRRSGTDRLVLSVTA